MGRGACGFHKLRAPLAKAERLVVPNDVEYHRAHSSRIEKARAQRRTGPEVAPVRRLSALALMRLRTVMTSARTDTAVSAPAASALISEDRVGASE